MNESHAIWCPHCHNKATVASFPNDRCPQCGKHVEAWEALTRNPYSPQTKERHVKRVEEEEA